MVALKATSVATGDSHTCTALPDKSVKCWGDNTYGQLGVDWALPRAYNPISVPGLTNATAVAGGAAHTCALLVDGTVRCWGSNVSGQLGNGSTTDSYTPVTVAGLSSAIAITASRPRLDNYGHTCALISGGAVQCWGRNIVGQLGTGNTTDSYVPTAVTGLAEAVTAVQTGGFHTCAILSGGSIQCWGDNALGQLGDGTTTTPRTTPVLVNGITNATALALGGNFSCALLADRTIRCWGDNSQGRLGNSTTTASLAPVTVSGISTAIAISAGRGHVCAALADKTVKCWGDNSAAMLGNGTTTNSSVPVSVSGLSNAVALSAGAVHTCAQLADSTLQCWGDNANAQVGPGSTTQSSTPASVLRFSPATAHSSVVDAAAGSQHSCGLMVDGTVDCWGGNGSHQIGTAAFARMSTASVVSGVSAASALSAGGWHNCALTGGAVQCWGENLNGELGDGTLTNSASPVTVSGISTAIAVAAGSVRTCAALSDGSARCWGDNDQGQLGDGTTTSSSLPVTVNGFLGAASTLAGGYNHTCGLNSTGAVQCWGGNYSGQLGDGSLNNSSVPVGVSGLGTLTTTSYTTTCPTCPAGRICTPCVPTTIVGMSYTGNVIGLASGNMSDHACAVLSDRSVVCWGDNTFGQLGNGTTTNATTPVTVSGISSATHVATGYGHTCARLVDSTVKCWGWNILGQLGDGTSTDALTPVTVSGLTDATSITTGFAQSCATRAGGGLQCWGDNAYSQLGLGVLAVSVSTPKAISVVSKTTLAGRSYPSCLLSILAGPSSCVLDGNLIIRAGTFVMVLPLPPE
ncbi:MAG: RCC1 repeat-containing protein [Gammaproteobacteria bacterium]|nr:RCC1 repeat-containing protein [Gammaproteobacteria bacterium]